MRTYRMKITMDAKDEADFANAVMMMKERRLIDHISPVKDFEDVVAENDLLKFILAINKIPLTDELITDAKEALQRINKEMID
jgi:spermidine/putrescine-binding protein